MLGLSNWLLGLSTVIGQKVTNLEVLESASINKGVSGEHLTRCLFNINLSKIWAIQMEHFVHKKKLLSVKSILKKTTRFLDPVHSKAVEVLCKPQL